MKKRAWPVAYARVGKTDVTIRTILPASSQTILFEVSYDYFTAKLKEAKTKGDDHDIKRYGDFLRLLNNNPLSKQNKLAAFQRKTLSDMLKSKKFGATKIGRRLTGESSNRGFMEKWKKRPHPKKKVERTTLPQVQQGTVGALNSAPAKSDRSFLDRTRTRIFATKTKNAKNFQINVPEKYQNSPYGNGLDVVVEVPSRDTSASPKRGRRMGAFC